MAIRDMVLWFYSFYSYYSYYRLSLCASDDHAGTHALRLAEAVESAELVDRDVVLLGNRFQRVALDHLVVDTLAAVVAGIATVDLLAAVAAIAHLADGG